jgi:superfamily II DNA or RNA helicase
MNYEQFVNEKLVHVPATGIPDGEPRDGDHLFEFQRDLIRWALRRGRAAIFADTGLGKSRMQLEWAHGVVEYTGKPVLILCPLAVADQTVKEAADIGLAAVVCREQEDCTAPICVTNYERIHKFDCESFGGVVLDESSIIKHHTAKTLAVLMDAFEGTAFKLCCTATPSPNDYTELGTHAEFLGVCSRNEMLAEFFVHDGGDTAKWRLKGHARPVFWRWVASWGALVRLPSDLGYADDGYLLPERKTIHHMIEADRDSVKKSGLLFAEPARTLTERRRARAGSIEQRVKECAELVNASDETWIVWCALNKESDLLTRAIDGAVEVRGSQTVEEKESRLRDFTNGKIKTLVSKSSICGFGMNWQHCSNMAFVGVTDSWEAYYQAVRRIWRFGQTEECNIHIFSSELEGSVVANLKRKEADAIAMSEELSSETSDHVKNAVCGLVRSTTEYKPILEMEVPQWIL